MLTNQVVVITGGAGLIGQAFCRETALQGAVVVVADINFDAADRVASEITTNGGQAVPYALDICDKNSIEGLIESIDNSFGTISAVVNNAYPRNKHYGRHLEDIEYEDFCENINLHLGGYFLVSQQFAKYFKQASQGKIINMGSIYGVMPPRFEIYEDTQMTTPMEYASIKSAVIHMTKYFAQYYKKYNIQCNCISPGGVLDNQPAAFLEKYKQHCGTKGMLNSDSIIGTLLFLLSNHSSYITGQNIIVDDGFSL